MPYARNRLDGTRIYFEDDGGRGAPVVFHGGLLDTVTLVRGSPIAQALQPRDEEFRLVYVDHRGIGRSDKPLDVEADAVAVLEELDIEQAHFIGTSYGGRLGFGIGEHAPKRVLSLVIGGQQPFAMDPNTPVARAITEGAAAAQKEGMEAFVEALETVFGTRVPDAQRAVYLDNDPAAVEAMCRVMLDEGAIATDLGSWSVPCLIFIGARDADFIDEARRAADEIPNSEFISLEELGHMGAHLQHDVVLPAVLRTLRAAG
jgi:3-oxoadipate enol-lactonase